MRNWAILRVVFALSMMASVVAFGPTTAGAAPVACAGIVFQDFDADGERSEDYSFVNDQNGSGVGQNGVDADQYENALDPGVAGVLVTVTSADGDVFTDSTDATGAWSVTVDDANDFPLRVEFSDAPAGWTATSVGPDSGTFTQFIANAADCGNGPNGNVGMAAPGTFCENAPDFVTSCYLFGNVAGHDGETAVLSISDGAQDDDSEADWISVPGTTPPETYEVLATLGEVGTVWGQGFDPTTDDVFAGSFVKRHTRLGPNGNPTTIYRIPDGGTPEVFAIVDAGAANPHSAAADEATYGLAAGNGWYYDFAAFDAVGKTGLGDVEVTRDGSTLFAVDLGNRELVSYAIQNDGSAGTRNATAINGTTLGIPSSECDANDIRAFGLGLDGADLLHLGVVCTAESTIPASFDGVSGTDTTPAGNPAELAAWVFSFDGSTFAEVTDVPVDTTTRGSQVGGGASFSSQSDWRPWVSVMPYNDQDFDQSWNGNTYPQPMVSDISFDGNDMIVSMMDRWGHQTGANAFYVDPADDAIWSSGEPIASGDIMRGVYNDSTGTYSFPKTGVEFTYDGDAYGTSHLETTIGATAQIPGRPYVVSVSFDPNEAGNTWQSGGLEWFDNTTGDYVNGVRLYNGRPASPFDVGTFEKAAGLGDLEAACSAMAIQVGNRIWFDANWDGIQDPGETGMNGVVVELVQGGVVVDTVTTSGDGNYIFEDVTPGVSLDIRIAQSNFDPGGVFAAGGSHEDYPNLTVVDTGADDGDDSDASLVSGLPTITVNTSATDHTFDFGFVNAPLRVGNRVFLDEDGNGSQNGTEPGIDDVTVQLWSTDAAGDPVAIIATDVTASGGFYVFESLIPGDYVIAIPDAEQATGEELDGLASTTGNGTAPDPDDNAELDDNGDPRPGFASISLPVTLSDNGEPTNDINEGGWDDEDSNLTVDFGFISPSVRLGNLVWEDLDADGIADDGEPGIADVTVQLWTADAAGDPVTNIATQVTGPDGKYSFDNLAPGDYIVAIPVSEQNTGNELDSFVSTGPGVAIDPETNADNDDNGDAATGFASISEPVTLVTNNEPTGETLRSDDAALDEDGTKADNDSNLTVDFGFIRQYRIGNLVWLDANNNGVADNGETPLGGVLVELWSVDAAGDPDTKLTDDTTDGVGQYSFDNLAPGDYIVAIPATEQDSGESLAGYTTSTGNDPAPDPDNNTNNDDNGTAAAAFAAISDPLTLSAGTPTGELSGLNGISEEFTGKPDANSDLTVDFGFIGDLRLGNRVFLDEDGNGSQNGSEPGIDDVTVQLWSVDVASDPVAIIATDTTSNGGFYVFENLVPGDYIVAIPDSEQATGQELAGLGSTTGNGTAPDADVNAGDLDDNGDPATGFASISLPVTLSGSDEPITELDEANAPFNNGVANNNSNLTVDFGFVEGLRLGNLVWEDLDRDGTADDGEPGIQGVIVELWSVDGAGDPLAQLATDTTDINGKYEFVGLQPGDYIVAISATEQALGEPLNTLTSTGAAASATDPDNGTDNDDNGDAAAGFASTSAPVTLVSNGEPTNETLRSDVGTDDEYAGYDDNDSNLSVDLGFVREYRLGNLVWIDTNNNGVADAGEQPVIGVTVQLWNADAAGNPTTFRTDTTTNGSGEYLFTSLPAGDYVVAIPAPEQNTGQELAGLTSSTGNGTAPDPDNGTDNDDNGDAATGFASISAAVTLSGAATTGETGGLDGTADESAAFRDDSSELTVDFGFIGELRLGNRVWLDENADGDQDTGENGIDNVVVQLWTANAAGDPVAQIATDTTSGGGFYLFENLLPGDYIVAIADGEQATGEPLVGLSSTTGNGTAPDVDVSAADLDDNGDPVTGFASISAPVTLAGGSEPTGEVDESGPIADNDSNLTVDFGFVEGLRLGNLVWEDRNGDGDVDAGEPGIDGVTVELYSGTTATATGTPVATDVTAGGGFYEFTGLAAGDYVVAIPDAEQTTGAELEFFVSTQPGVNAPDVDVDATDSDDNGDPATGFASVSDPVTLSNGGEPTGEANETPVADDNDSNLTVDFGFIRQYRIGNLVWFDANGNGIADANEPALDGVRVELRAVTAGGAPGALLEFTTTDSDGEYLFDDLAPGDYIVAIPATEQATGETLADMVSTAGNGVVAPDPDDSTDNDDNGDITVTYAAVSDPVSLFLDAPTGETGGLDGVSDEAGPERDTDSDLTVDFGFVGELRLGNRVFLDQDGNGAQNGSEPGIADVTVQLWSVDAGGAPVAILETAVTDPNGFYLFEGLLPADYVVAIPDTEQANGEDLDGLASTEGNGADAPDADVNAGDLDDNGDPIAGFASISDPVTLTDGGEPTSEVDESGPISDNDSNLTVDFGFVSADLRLGNLVWDDRNGDGDVDAGEPGIADVTVQLWSVDAAGDPVAIVATDTTDASGNYLFSNLLPGEYIVAIPDAEQTAGNELEDFISTLPAANAPDADTDQDDNDDNGDPVAGFASISDPVTLITGNEPTGEADEDGAVADNDSNLTVDLGFVRQYRIGNLVWFDANNNGVADSGETALDGVRVELRAAGPGGAPGALIEFDTTDTNGRYLFEDLAPGDYVVVIPDSEQATGEALAGYVTSTGNDPAPDPDNGTDNDDNGTAGAGYAAVSAPVSLNGDTPTSETDGTSGVNAEIAGSIDTHSDLSVDFGFIGELRLGNRVFLDEDGNGSQNGSEPGIDDVDVQLWSVDAAGDPVAIIATDTTSGGGFYLFENLVPGDYIVAIPDSEQTAGNELEGLGSTIGNGTAPDADVNAGDLDDNGDAVTGFASISAPVTLTDNGEPTSEVDEAGPIADADSNLTVDFGFTEGLRLGNLVWDDLNGNGTADAGEPGIADVTVQLWTADVAGNPVAQIATDGTDPDGTYEFVGLAPGDYIVAIADGEQGVGQELDGLVSTGTTTAADPDSSADNDDNGDAAPGFASISAAVTLVSNNEPTTETLRTDDATLDEYAGFADNDSNLTVDLGFVREYRIGNLVWFDANNNGIADAGEQPIAGVDVQLWTADAAGAPVAQIETATTDGMGHYAFDGLAPGDYIVAIPASQIGTTGPLAGMTTSTGNDDITNSAPDPDNGTDNDDNGTATAGFAAISSALTLNGDTPGGETDGLTGSTDEFPGTPDTHSDLTVDFGFFGTLRLGNQVWLDEDGNGEQNGSEPGIDNVEVQLWSTDLAGNPVAIIATETTSGGGFYAFENLPAGSFIVAIAETQQVIGGALEGLASTGQPGTAAPADNDIERDDNGDAAPGFASISSPVVLGPGGEPTDDLDEDGLVPDGDSNMTVDFGFVPGVELGNLVWFDANNNGVVDAGETGSAGVTVELISGGIVVDSTVTDANGYYVFSGVTPGTYVVSIPASEFAPGGSLTGWFASSGSGVSTNANDDVDNNSDGSVTSGNAVVSSPITVTGSTEPIDEVDESPTGTGDADSNLTVDFGFYQLSLGDQVWFDDNNNGVLDGAELPVPGVTLVLLDGAGNPVLGPDGQPRTATTDANGNYAFTGLPEGTYIVEIPSTNTAVGGPLDDRASSSGNDVAGTAPDPDGDIESDDNGDFVLGGTTRSKPIDLAAGTEPGGSENATVDFGFTPAAGLGSYAWVDTDRDGIRDAGEDPLPGVTVTVRDAETNAIVGVTVTDANGRWEVRGLPPGTYYVEFVDPEGRPFTSQNTGTNDSVDSDVSATGVSGIVDLGIGEFDPTVGVGVVSSTNTITTIVRQLPTTGPALLGYILALSGLLLGGGVLLLGAGRRRQTVRVEDRIS